MKTPIGSTMYIHSPNALAARPRSLMISSHGRAVHDKKFIVPYWVRLHFFTRHGLPLSEARAGDVMAGQLPISETLRPGDESYDYLLSKFQGHHNSEGDDGESYQSLQDDINFSGRFEVLTIRNRWFTPGVTLNAALRQLDRTNRRYANILCVFCR